jgi:hypothetical protein
MTIQTIGSILYHLRPIYLKNKRYIFKAHNILCIVYTYIILMFLMCLCIHCYIVLHSNEYYHLLNDIDLECSIKRLPYKLIHRLSSQLNAYFLYNRHCLLSNRTDIFHLQESYSSCSLLFNALIFPFGTNQKCLCLILAINGSIHS